MRYRELSQRCWRCRQLQRCRAMKSQGSATNKWRALGAATNASAITTTDLVQRLLSAYPSVRREQAECLVTKRLRNRRYCQTSFSSFQVLTRQFAIVL